MWGMTNRAVRLGASRARGATKVGLTQLAVRGPVEHSIVELAGEIDFTCIDAVIAEVTGLPNRVMSIDVSLLEFVDVDGVIGLKQLARILGQRDSHDESVPIVGMSARIARTFALVERKALLRTVSTPTRTVASR